MAVIDRYLPAFDVSEHHLVRLAVPPDVAYRAVRALDMARSRPVLALLAIRAGLSLLTPRRAVAQYRFLQRPIRLTVDDVQRAGFVLLEDRPGEEIVLGAIGKFWRPASGLRRIHASEFGAFAEPGYAKAALNFRVEPDGPGGSVVSTETRVLCTDAPARRAFRRYWRLIGPFSSYIRARLLSMVKATAESSPRAEAGTMDREA